MLYQKFQGYLCQERGKETDDLALDCEPDIDVIDTELMDSRYPLHSGSWLLFYGVSESGQAYDKEATALLIPEYNQPCIPMLGPNSLGYYKSEFFYYHNNDYVIYVHCEYGDTFVGLEVHKRNGDFHQMVKLVINGCYDLSYAKIVISPSGRYLFYCEHSTEDVQGDAVSKSIGRIMEIVHDKNTLEFKLEERRVIDDFKERYDKDASSINTYDYYSDYTFFLTDKMELLYVNKTHDIIMYEEIK